MTGLAPVCCCAALRQSCLVVSLVVSLVIHIVGGAARSLDRTTSHTQKLKSFWPGRRIRDPAPGEKKSRKARARRPQILSLRSLLVTESQRTQILNLKFRKRKNPSAGTRGKPSEFHWSKGGMCVQKEAHWPARYRSITRVGDRPALRADAPTQRGLRTLQPSARASRREGAFKRAPATGNMLKPPDKKMKSAQQSANKPKAA